MSQRGGGPPPPPSVHTPMVIKYVCMGMAGGLVYVSMIEYEYKIYENARMVKYEMYK